MRAGNAFNIGNIFGIQLRLHYSWFVIFALITISLVHPNWSQPYYWMLSIITSLLFFASVIAHEMAHSLVGKSNGIPVQSITLFIFGGVARITREAHSPGAELKMALAGPACSLVLGGLFGLLWLLTQSHLAPVAMMALWLASVNGLLALFNLIPGFPLDGGRVFRSLLWRYSGDYRRATTIATWAGRIIGYLFIAFGAFVVVFQPWGIYWFSGLWLAAIGWFLSNAATVSYRQTQWQESLKGLPISQLVDTNPVIVPPELSIEQLVQQFVSTAGLRRFLIIGKDGLMGILTLRDIRAVPRNRWHVTQIREVMTPLSKLVLAHPEQDALATLQQMYEKKISQMPVISDGKVTGMITRESLIELLRTRSKLGI